MTFCLIWPGWIFRNDFYSLLHIGNCSTKVSVLKYKNFDACNNSIQSSLIEIPIVSKNPPVGLQNWNDGKILKFTQCSGDMFTCHTYGNCISMNKRCDGHHDCPLNGEDENNCVKMNLNSGYIKTYPAELNTKVYIKLIIKDHS